MLPMARYMIEVEIDLPDCDQADLPSVPPNELGAAMDADLRPFEQWFRGQGNGPLVGAERAILKSYLAWKLLHETAGVDTEAGGGDVG